MHGAVAATLLLFLSPVGAVAQSIESWKRNILLMLTKVENNSRPTNCGRVCVSNILRSARSLSARKHRAVPRLSAGVLHLLIGGSARWQCAVIEKLASTQVTHRGDVSCSRRRWKPHTSFFAYFPFRSFECGSQSRRYEHNESLACS